MPPGKSTPPPAGEEEWTGTDTGVIRERPREPTAPPTGPGHERTLYWRQKTEGIGGCFAPTFKFVGLGPHEVDRLQRSPPKRHQEAWRWSGGIRELVDFA